MQWLLLLLAISFEIIGTTLMKMSYGFTKLLPTIGTLIFYICSITFLSQALKTIPVSVAYAIWSVAGIVIISTIGIIFFKESVSTMKIASTVLIAMGVIGLYLSY